MTVILYIVGGGILVGLSYAVVRSQKATAATLEAIREQTEHAQETWALAQSEVSEGAGGPEASWTARVAELETELAALRREVNDIDEKAEHRFRRLTARAQRAAESEEEDDAEAEVDPETLRAALRAEQARSSGNGPAGSDRNLKRRRRRKKPWLP